MSSGSQHSVIPAAKHWVKTILRVFSIGWSTQAGMTSDLKSLGVRPGGVLMVHSSLSSLGYVWGGAATVIQSLLEVLGPTGTLVMPTHSWDVMEAGCRVFHVRETKSCVGAITEEFRRMPGALRSVHPSHSIAAIGPLAAELVSGHETCSTPCGIGTPYEKICRTNGQVLFVGTTLDSNTIYHTIEAMAGLSYLMKSSADTFTIVDQAGEKKELTVWRHKAGIPRRFSDWQDFLTKEGVINAGKAGKARALLLEATTFLDMMLDRVRRDPRMLLR
jgi:aminoglycoside 3-N-acetyltransferase